MTDSAPFYIMVYNISNLTLLLVCIMYMDNCSGQDWPRRRAQPWNPGYIRRRSSSTSTSTVSSTSPSSTSSSKEFSPTPNPVSSSSFPSTYSFTPSTEQSQVALPVLMMAGCIVGTCLCGMALAVNHMWRTKTKTRTRRNEQPVENQQ